MAQPLVANSQSSSVAANPVEVLLNGRVDPGHPLEVYRLIEEGLALADVLRLVETVALLNNKAVHSESSA